MDARDTTVQDERIDMLVRLNGGDEREAFRVMLAERDVLYHRCKAAELALSEYRALMANGTRRIDRHWRERAEGPDGA